MSDLPPPPDLNGADHHPIASSSKSTIPIPIPIPNPVPTPTSALSTSARSRSTQRRASFPSASSEEILASVDEPPRPTAALLKHGKYIVLGVGGIWYTGFGEEVGRVLMNEHEHGWVRRTLLTAFGSHVLTIIIFLYLVLFLPWFRGYIPNYPRWQQSRRLRVLVPVLTVTILLGWTCYVVSLSQTGKRAIQAAKDAFHAVGDDQSTKTKLSGEGMGVMKAMAGTTALYTLTLGVLGFIPYPDVPVRVKKA